ncbi:cytoplasmic protein [Vararia minispora EC-137]|uniref:Cytoplasmic protein n=1 Tax=Vararia minispora EC-137 TaxID=1314806 RepID=A0ACB8Q5J0_9AGAM|nr:cytoplasmic protein [Vararia minispora EC-137]
MEDQFKELLQFLHDKNPQVRQLALQNLLTQTPKDAPYRKIFFAGIKTGGTQKPKDPEVIRDLKLLCRDNLAIAHDAFKALVNLSDSPMLASPLSEPNFLDFLVSYIVNPHATLSDLACMLLSNLTSVHTAGTALLSLEIKVIIDASVPGGLYPTQSRAASCPTPVPYPSGEEHDVRALPLLIDAFVQATQTPPTGVPDKKRKGDLHFLASVFANLTATPRGREYFLTPEDFSFGGMLGSKKLEFPLSKLVAFTEHPDLIRRGGVDSLIKNCCFNKQAHLAMLSSESSMVSIPPSTEKASGMGCLPYILLPLAGSEEFDLEDQELLPPALQFLPPTKKRESDPALRLLLVETLLLLCTTRWGRDYLRTNGVYQVVRALHEQETDEKVSEHVERLVNLIKRDEGPETIHDGIIETAGDEDDEDSKIEEV